MAGFMGWLGFHPTVTWNGEDVAKIQKGLRLLKQAGVWLKPILETIGERVVEHTDTRWGKEVDPRGNAWKPLNEHYRAWKVKEGRIDKILQSTGRLRHSIAWQLVGRMGVAIGTPVDYASYQQNDQTRRGLGRYRPFLGVDRSDRISIGKIIAKEIRKVLQD